MNDGVTLRASSLWSKFGFEDGDVLFDAMSRLGLVNPDGETYGEDILLEACIRRYLLPALPAPVEIQLINTHHNPVRVAPYWFNGIEAPDWADKISVEVTDAQLRDLYKELKL
jgi:hypothetical protein